MELVAGTRIWYEVAWRIFQVHKNVFQKRNENAAQDVKSLVLVANNYIKIAI